MKFTIEANSDLARAIQARRDTGMTLSIVAHDPTYTETEKVITARMMSWTIRKGCAHAPDEMDVEWMDHGEFKKLLPPSCSPLEV
jgi:hypothetical protein